MKKRLGVILLVVALAVAIVLPGAPAGATVDSVQKGTEQTQPVGRNTYGNDFAAAIPPQIITPTEGIGGDSFEPEQYTDNYHFQVFDEQQGVVLGSDLTPDWGSTIPSGTTVNSHFVHFDQVGTTTWFRACGEITFDGDIIGLIVLSDSLDATDTLLGLDVTYPPASVDYRGLESTGDQDLYWVSGDTLWVDLQALNWLDQIRVITEPAEVSVPVDIKPTSCPNPLNVNSKGVLPVAILGTDTFDVTDVDPATVRLEGVAPLRWSLEDVATPFDGEITEGCCECCTIAGPDGFMDLTLKFDTQEIVAALSKVEDGDCLRLTLTGELYDGTDIMGIDVIKVIKKGENGNGG